MQFGVTLHYLGYRQYSIGVNQSKVARPLLAIRGCLRAPQLAA